MTAVKCPILQRPINGGLVPARCHDDQRGYNEFGQRCVAYCRHGYRLRGAPTKYCQHDKSWSQNTGLLECVKGNFLLFFFYIFFANMHVTRVVCFWGKIKPWNLKARFDFSSVYFF